MLFLDMSPVIVFSSKGFIAGWTVAYDSGIAGVVHSALMTAKVFLQCKTKTLPTNKLETLERAFVPFVVLARTSLSLRCSSL